MFKTVTSTDAEPDSAFAAVTVTVYSCVSSASNDAGGVNRGEEASVALSKLMSDEALRADHAYAYDDGSGEPERPEAEQLSAKAAAPSYAEYGWPAHVTASCGLFRTVTVTSAVASSA